MRLRLVFMVLSVSISRLAAGELTVGERPPPVSLRWAYEETRDAAAWHSNTIRDRIFALFYVDPDKRALNDHVSEALDRAAFSTDVFRSIAVINMDATRIPDFILNRMLAARQRKYPKAVFLRDFGRTLVHSWGLADNSYDIVLFDEEGKVLLVSKGHMTEATLKEFIRLIAEGVKRLG